MDGQQTGDRVLEGRGHRLSVERHAGRAELDGVALELGCLLDLEETARPDADPQDPRGGVGGHGRCPVAAGQKTGKGLGGDQHVGAGPSHGQLAVGAVDVGERGFGIDTAEIAYGGG